MLLITILRMEGRRGRPRQKLDDGGRILETPGEGATSIRMDSLDIWNCREADDLKKKTLMFTTIITSSSLLFSLQAMSIKTSTQCLLIPLLLLLPHTNLS